MILEATLAAVGGFAGYVVLVLFALRVLKATAPAVVVILSALVAYLGLIVIVSTVHPPFLFWPYSAVYWFLTLCFLMVFGAIYKSISLRILADLSSRPNRRDDYQDILNRYIHRDSFQDRVRILVADSLAIRSNSGLELTEKGRRIARMIIYLQCLFKIERSG